MTFKLHNHVAIEINGKKITGQIVGIDTYSLENFKDTEHSWPSYTLVSDKKGTFSRFWITDWKKQGWVLWTGLKKFSDNGKPVMERSGIARIEFAGDQGISTPSAALAIYKTKEGDYCAAERFTASTTMFFKGQKIPKPKTVSVKKK